MKSTTRTASVEPAIGATSAHLTVIDNAFMPRAVTLGAILAGSRDGNSSEVSEKSLDVAAAFHIERDFGTALLDRS